ncbi:MAG: GNAT family N-acetyltransferase [Desulfobacterales bacterium]|nr:GNAT family N-acetyltransferase [Desulfobacterales bacterium]
MRILKANITDLQDISALITACRLFLINAGVHQWDEAYPDSGIICRDISQGELYIAMIAGELVGGVTLNQNEDPEYSQIPWRYSTPALVIHRLCVSPSRQGHGIGSALMAFAEEHARAARHSSIRLDVYSGNPIAVNLYKHLGYSTAGQFTFPSREHPFYCMEKCI